MGMWKRELETAGEGREGISKLIYCSNIKKKRTFYGDGHDGPPPSSSLSRLCFHPHQASPLCVVASRAHASGVLFLTSGVDEASWCCRVVSWVVVEVLGDRGRQGMWFW